jgi:hypothetical protein
MSICINCKSDKPKGLVVTHEFFCSYECYDKEYDLE